MGTKGFCGMNWPWVGLRYWIVHSTSVELCGAPAVVGIALILG